MPQLHPSRRTGHRLLATTAIAAVAVLGTPAVASADVADDIREQIEAGIGGLTPGGSTGDEDGGGTGAPVGGGTTPDPEESISAGAKCVDGLISGIEVSVTGIADGVADALAGLLGQSPIQLPPTGADSVAGVIPTNPDQVAAALDPGTIEEAIADGQEQVTMLVEVVVDGVVHVVEVVVEFLECLAALIPAPAAPPTTPPSTQPAAPVTTPAPVPAVTTSAAPVQAVAYPGYAPTGGAPSEDGSPAALVGLGLLTAATGGGALWLRARRGVAG